MSRVQTNPNYFVENKSVEQRTSSLERASTQTSFQPGDVITSGATSRPGCLLCNGATYLASLYPNLALRCPQLLSGGNLVVPNLMPLSSGVNYFIFY
jgi:hypothetical protein